MKISKLTRSWTFENLSKNFEIYFVFFTIPTPFLSHNFYLKGIFTPLKLNNFITAQTDWTFIHNLSKNFDKQSIISNGIPDYEL